MKRLFLSRKFAMLGIHQHRLGINKFYSTTDEDDYVLPLTIFDVEYAIVHRKFIETEEDKYNIALVRLKDVLDFEGDSKYLR